MILNRSHFVIVTIGFLTACTQSQNTPTDANADSADIGNPLHADGATDVHAGDVNALPDTPIPPHDVAPNTDANPPLTPSHYLLITAERLATLHTLVAASDPRWLTLKANVDANVTAATPGYDTSPENAATVYLFTNDVQYANAAYTWAHALVVAADVRSDSYLAFGDDMRQVAMVLNYCYPALTSAQRTELAGYLDQWTDELWNHNMGSGWGLSDPGNNYFYSFVQGTAFAGYELREVSNSNATAYITTFTNKVTGSGGALDYVNTVVSGGEWIEGSNYGERAKERMFLGLAVAATMDGTNYFTQSPFFANSIYYQIYTTQPGHLYAYPGGDLARDSSMPVSPFDRDIVLLDTYFSSDANARAYGQGFLTNVVPDYTGPDFNDKAEYYLDFLFALAQPASAETSLPTNYHASGSQWVNLRSGWDAHATSVSISGAPLINQSHQHDDVGSFVIWREGWLAGDASTWSHSGEISTPDAHNMISLAGVDHDVAMVPGLTLFDDEGTFSYVQIDGSREFAASGATLLAEWTRDFVYLRASDALIVYDRVSDTGTTPYDWRVHFPTQPTMVGTAFTASYQGGSIALQPVSGGAATIVADTDLSDPATSYRVQETAAQSPGRLLNILRVATGAPPDVTSTHVQSTGQMEGLVWSDQVVLFSSNPRGAAAALPVSYTIPGTSVRTHTIASVSGPIDVNLTHANGMTTVTVSAGTHITPTSAGVAQFTM